jgi:hydrogenase nickel incorporation protein HypB
MCTTCGCSGPDTKARIGGTDVHGSDQRPGGEGARDLHAPPHAHSHSDSHSHSHANIVSIEQEVLAKNNRSAERLRAWLENRGIVALNLMSSPGAGKTTLLERTIRDLRAELPIAVVEGDQETVFDAERIRATGCPTVQLNTGSGCHLEADMLTAAVDELMPPEQSILMIENVGNLVCPALFDLGEHAKAVVLSVTEGADKPLKYPYMFRACRLMIINKIDLLPYVEFDVGRCLEYARRVNPDLEVLHLSATTGEGLDNWYAWLRQRLGGAPAESAG